MNCECWMTLESPNIGYLQFNISYEASNQFLSCVVKLYEPVKLNS